MPTKKEQTVEGSQKAKTSVKKPSATAARAAKAPAAALAPEDSPSAKTAASAPAQAAARKTAKRPSKKADPAVAISAASAPSPHTSEHHETHAPAGPGSQEYFDQHSVTPENISVRAYFIGEHRRAYAIAGTSEEDWLEAERQLRAEAISSLASLRSGLQN